MILTSSQCHAMTGSATMFRVWELDTYCCEKQTAFRAATTLENEYTDNYFLILHCTSVSAVFPLYTFFSCTGISVSTLLHTYCTYQTKGHRLKVLTHVWFPHTLNFTSKLKMILLHCCITQWKFCSLTTTNAPSVMWGIKTFQSLVLVVKNRLETRI